MPTTRPAPTYPPPDHPDFKELEILASLRGEPPPKRFYSAGNGRDKRQQKKHKHSTDGRLAPNAHKKTPLLKSVAAVLITGVLVMAGLAMSSMSLSVSWSTARKTAGLEDRFVPRAEYEADIKQLRAEIAEVSK